MRKVGKLSHLTARGTVARVYVAGAIGEPLFDEKGERIGNIIDVFGPVAHPYVAIKPASGMNREKLASIVSMDIYMRDVNEKEVRGRKNRMPRMRKRKTCA